MVTGDSGTSPQYSLTNLTFTTAAVNGGTTTATDIAKARVCGLRVPALTFATSGAGVSQFGTDASNPSGSFNITGSATLIPGANYFWLVYDISPTAALNDYVDAAFTTINSTSVSVGDPVGNRQVEITGTGIPILYYDFEVNSNRTILETTPEQQVTTGNSFTVVGSTETSNTGDGGSWGGTNVGTALYLTGGFSGDGTAPSTTPSTYVEFDINTTGFKGISVGFDFATDEFGSILVWKPIGCR